MIVVKSFSRSGGRVVVPDLHEYLLTLVLATKLALLRDRFRETSVTVDLCSEEITAYVIIAMFTTASLF